MGQSEADVCVPSGSPITIRSRQRRAVVGSTEWPGTFPAQPKCTTSAHKEENMGIVDDAKDALDATGKKIGRVAEDATERVSDRVDELKADAHVKQAEADVKKAEAERDSTHAKNDLKANLRGDN